MMQRSLLAAALLMSTALSGLAQTAPEITRIELGQAGIARYTLVAGTDGNRVTFDVPRAHSDDVLASLIVLDPAGGVVDLQTDTPGSVDAALADSPFAGGLPTTPGALLAALKGETVTVTTGRGNVEGRVLSTGRVDIVEGDVTVSRETVLLLSATGIAEIVLTPGTRVTFPQEAAAGLAAAMDAGHPGDDRRRFELTLDVSGDRDIGLTYVTEAAAWKNSWRLLLDRGRLQGWATLENVSGSDWDSVAVTLTTGVPVAYRRELIDPLYIARPRLPNTLPPDLPVPAPMAEPMTLSLFRNGAEDAAELVMYEAAPSGTARAGEAVTSTGILRYALPAPLDLAAGRTANLMYIDLPIEPEIRALFRQGSRSDSVFLAAALESDQALASGVISVQDADGFVGDAPFDGMLAGARTLLPFATATDASVTTLVDSKLRIEGVVYNRGRLTISSTDLFTTEYAAILPEQAALFSVEHFPNGEFDSANGEVEREDGLVRVTVPVTGGKAVVSVIDRNRQSWETTLGSDDFAALLLQVQTGETEAASAVVDAFKAAHALMQRQTEITTRLAGLDERREDLFAEQSRLRENLKAVEQEALRSRYLQALDRTETEIGEIFDTHEALRTEAEDIDAEIEAIFRAP